MASRLTAEDKQHILKRYQDGASLRRSAGRSAARTSPCAVPWNRRDLLRAAEDHQPALLPGDGSACPASLRRGPTWKEIIEQAGVTSVTLGKILGRNGRELTASRRRGQRRRHHRPLRGRPQHAGHRPDARPRQEHRQRRHRRQAASSASGRAATTPTTSTRSTRPRRRTGSASSAPTAAWSPPGGIPRGITSRSG